MKNNKTIGITTRFFTNALPERVGAKNELIPHWAKGVIVIEANKAKGIKAQSVHFNTLEEHELKFKQLMAKAKFASVSI
jgi:hypothetical protein